MAHRVIFVHGPTQDADSRYYGWPTSLLYAISPTIDAIRSGQLSLEVVPRLYEPYHFTDGINEKEVLLEWDKSLNDVDIICASVTYDSLYPTICLLKHAKKKNPNTITIVGGPHIDEVHADPKFSCEVMQQDEIDFIIAGDGEYALLAVLNGLARGDNYHSWFDKSKTCGTFKVYYHGKPIITLDTPLDLDLLPPLPMEMADNLRRRSNLARLLRYSELLPATEMIAHRGCVFGCDCCSERRMPVNAKSIDSIIEEVDLRKRQGFRAVFFNDSTFGNYPHLKQLLAQLGKTGMKFGCLNRFDKLINYKLLEHYKRAGFVYFYCAIEQFDDSMLKEIKKAENTERISVSMQLLNELDIKVGVSLLYGMPFETRESVGRTIDYVEHWINTGTIRLVSQAILTFHPGTPFRNHLSQGFNRVPPNIGYPFNRFEEGQWYHLPHVTGADLEWIDKETERRFGMVLVRGRHSDHDLDTTLKIPKTGKPEALT